MKSWCSVWHLKWATARLGFRNVPNGNILWAIHKYIKLYTIGCFSRCQRQTNAETTLHLLSTPYSKFPMGPQKDKHRLWLCRLGVRAGDQGGDSLGKEWVGRPLGLIKYSGTKSLGLEPIWPAYFSLFSRFHRALAQRRRTRVPVPAGVLPIQLADLGFKSLPSSASVPDWQT